MKSPAAIWPSAWIGMLGLKTKRTKMKRFYKNWPMHNIVAHPLMQILAWIGLVSMANKVHDATLPPNAGIHRAAEGRPVE